MASLLCRERDGSSAALIMLRVWMGRRKLGVGRGSKAKLLQRALAGLDGVMPALGVELRIGGLQIGDQENDADGSQSTGKKSRAKDG